MRLLLNKYTYKMSPLKIEMFSVNFSVIIVSKHITSNIESSTVCSNLTRTKN